MLSVRYNLLRIRKIFVSNNTLSDYKKTSYAQLNVYANLAVFNSLDNLVSFSFLLSFSIISVTTGGIFLSDLVPFSIYNTLLFVGESLFIYVN